MNKEELRKEMRRRSRAFGDGIRKEWSDRICEDILRDGHVKSAKVIVAFYPLKDEVDIRRLIDTLASSGKLVLLPEVTGEGEMKLKEYGGVNEMSKGRFGISVPAGGVFTNYESVDCVLVPGVAFTRSGERLGRGKGCYDRFLPKVKTAWKRGVCFPYQILADIPCEPHDVKMDYV